MSGYASKGHRLLAQYMALQEVDAAWLAHQLRAWAPRHPERDEHRRPPYRTARRVVAGKRPSRITAELIQLATYGAVLAADFKVADTEDTP
jgi:hypothetical protein